MSYEDAVMRTLLALVEATDPAPHEGAAAREDLRQLAEAVAAVSQAYTRERDAIDAGATGEAAYRARRRFYLPRDGAKVVKPLVELHRAGALPRGPRWRVLDLGAGLGSTSLGVAATLLHLGRGGAAVRQVRPDEGSQGAGSATSPSEREVVRELRVDAVERDAGALRHFSQLAAQAERAGLPRLQVRPLAVDLRKHVPEGPYDLIVAGLVLNELLAEPPAQAAARLAGLVAQLAPGGAVIVLEPALREPTRALHQTRDALTAHPDVALFGPCVHRAPCPMLAGPKDWCHEDVSATLPDALAAVAREAGLRFERLTYAYLTLRRADAPADGVGGGASGVAALLDPGAAEGAPHRVVSQTLATKGKREWFACGAAGRVRVTRLDRHATAANAGFERAQRGDVVRLPVLAPGVTDLRVRAESELPGWFYPEEASEAGEALEVGHRGLKGARPGAAD